MNIYVGFSDLCLLQKLWQTLYVFVIRFQYCTPSGSPKPWETPTCLLYAGLFLELAQSSGMYFCLIKNLKSIYLAKGLALSNELNGSPTSDSARHLRPPMAVSGIFMERTCSSWDPFWIRAHFHKTWPMESPKCLLPAYPTHLCSARPGTCEIAKLSGLCAYLLGCMSRAYLCSQDRVFIPCQSHPHLRLLCI